jgi:putative glycosyltransferase (TIGR04372 family)
LKDSKVNIIEKSKSVVHNKRLTIERKITQIREAEIQTLIDKIQKLFIKTILIILALLGVFLIRLFRPFVNIRLGELDISRIGRFEVVDWYLSAQENEEIDKRNLDVFFFYSSNSFVCNYQWIKMWKRLLRVAPFGILLHEVDQLNKLFPRSEMHEVPLGPHITPDGTNDRLKKIVIKKKEPHLFFTLEEEQKGEAELRNLGVEEARPFVCFHARDSSYLDKTQPERDWSYHDYRDSDIMNYLPAIENLTQLGYLGIRMGAVVKVKLDSVNPAIIDYASNRKRSDFLDVYLAYKCFFFVCSDTGISQLAETFRKPMVYVNWTTLHRMLTFSNGLVIFKSFYDVEKKSFLAFREILVLLQECALTEDFERLNIRLIENTPQEIEDIIFEMDKRLKGQWKGKKEDELLQQQFWTIFNNELRHPNFRVGAEFLRQNRNLLN